MYCLNLMSVLELSDLLHIDSPQFTHTDTHRHRGISTMQEVSVTRVKWHSILLCPFRANTTVCVCVLCTTLSRQQYTWLCAAARCCMAADGILYLGSEVQKTKFLVRVYSDSSVCSLQPVYASQPAKARSRWNTLCDLLDCAAKVFHLLT